MERGQKQGGFAWRCTCCGSLLGMRQASQRLEIKHKEHAVVVVGPAHVVVPCRRCRTENKTSMTTSGTVAA